MRLCLITRHLWYIFCSSSDVPLYMEAHLGQLSSVGDKLGKLSRNLSRNFRFWIKQKLMKNLMRFYKTFKILADNIWKYFFSQKTWRDIPLEMIHMKYQALFSGKDMYYLTSIYICDLNSLPVCKDTICVLHHKKQQKPTHPMSMCFSTQWVWKWTRKAFNTPHGYLHRYAI